MDNLALKLDAITAEKSGVLRLTLTDFRNYQFLRINAELCPIIITGENGCGKTNILEAISFLTPGRGLRSAKLSDIRRITPALVSDEYSPTEISSLNWAVSAQVQNNEDVIEIGTAVEKSARETEDDSIRSFERRIVKINGVKISSQAELGKYISANWLTPQMDRLFRGGSQPRRSFLDRDRENQVIPLRTDFQLVQQKRHLLQYSLVQRHGIDIIQRNVQLLILVIAVIIVVLQTVPLLGSNDLAHHHHSRIIFFPVTFPPGTHDHLVQQYIIRRQLNIETFGFSRNDGNSLRLITNG